MRKAFNFYSSFDEVMKEFSISEKGIFIEAMLDVQFMRKHIDDINFEDKTLRLLWKSIKHSMLKQLEGYCNARKTTYNRGFLAYEGAYEGTSVQGEGEEEGEVQVQGQVAAPQEVYVQPTPTPSNQGKTTSKAKPNIEYTEEFNNIWKNYTREFYNKASGRNDVRKIDTFKNFSNIMKHKFNLPDNSLLTNYKIINFAIEDEINAYNESKKIPKALCNILKIDQLQELIDQNTGQ